MPIFIFSEIAIGKNTPPCTDFSILPTDNSLSVLEVMIVCLMSIP